jgi:hypothetical protein
VPFVTDGPYAETKAVLAGYWIAECDSFDRATELQADLRPAPPEHVAANACADVRPTGGVRHRSFRPDERR